MAAEVSATNDLFVAAVAAIYASTAEPPNGAEARRTAADVLGDVGANSLMKMARRAR